MSMTAREAKEREKTTRNRLKAMSHPLRARVLRLLVERGVQSPNQLARALKAELSDVSYHMRALVRLECVELVSERPVRGAVEHFYRATELHLIDTDEWEELDPMVGGDLVCEFMQRILDDFVASRKAGIVGSDKDFHITRTPMILDPEGIQEGMEVFEEARLKMAEVEARSAERMMESPKLTGTPVCSGITYFKVPRPSLNT
jgi:DNA-binding transcriptional ArsR family regulator